MSVTHDLQRAGRQKTDYKLYLGLVLGYMLWFRCKVKISRLNQVNFIYRAKNQTLASGLNNPYNLTRPLSPDAKPLKTPLIG